MKTPQFTLRDLFWLLLVAAIISFGIVREVTRERHIQSMERKVDYLSLLVYPEPIDYSADEVIERSMGMLREGESFEILCHHEAFCCTVRLKSGGEIVERRFTAKPRGCEVRRVTTSSTTP